MPRNRSPHPRTHSDAPTRVPEGSDGTAMEVVLKTDTVGSIEAVTQCVAALSIPGVTVRVIQSGAGEVSKSDVLMAATGSRLVIGFNTGIGPRAEDAAREQGVEIRLYEVIYALSEDLENIARRLLPRAEGERVTGRGEVIALFKSTRKGIILGCSVREGTLAVGKPFRVIDPAGTLYEGVIGTLHVGPKAVREARVGQQVGIKILDFQQARVGDLVECFERVRPSGPPPWTPQGGVLRR